MRPQATDGNVRSDMMIVNDMDRMYCRKTRTGGWESTSLVVRGTDTRMWHDQTHTTRQGKPEAKPSPHDTGHCTLHKGTSTIYHPSSHHITRRARPPDDSWQLRQVRHTLAELAHVTMASQNWVQKEHQFHNKRASNPKLQARLHPKADQDPVRLESWPLGRAHDLASEL